MGQTMKSNAKLETAAKNMVKSFSMNFSLALDFAENERNDRQGANYERRNTLSCHANQQKQNRNS
jgi:hypothetical protein